MKNKMVHFETDYSKHNITNDTLNDLKEKYLMIQNILKNQNEIENQQKEQINEIEKNIINIDNNISESENQANLLKKSTDKELKNLKYQIIFIIFLVIIIMLLLI